MLKTEQWIFKNMCIYNAPFGTSPVSVSLSLMCLLLSLSSVLLEILSLQDTYLIYSPHNFWMQLFVNWVKWPCWYHFPLCFAHFVSSGYFLFWMYLAVSCIYTCTCNSHSTHAVTNLYHHHSCPWKLLLFSQYRLNTISLEKHFHVKCYVFYLCAPVTLWSSLWGTLGKDEERV